MSIIRRRQNRVGVEIARQMSRGASTFTDAIQDYMKIAARELRSRCPLMLANAQTNRAQKYSLAQGDRFTFIGRRRLAQPSRAKMVDTALGKDVDGEETVRPPHSECTKSVANTKTNSTPST